MIANRDFQFGGWRPLCAKPIAGVAISRQSENAGGKEWRMNTLVRTKRTQISPEPRATCLADERRGGRTGGWEKRGMDVSRWFSSYCAKEGQGGLWEWEKFRLTSWKCLKRRTPTSVGTRALSVSHSKFSFPTSVSTVPLLYSPVPSPLLPFASTPFLRLADKSRESSSDRAVMPMQPGRGSLLQAFSRKGIRGARSRARARARMLW